MRLAHILAGLLLLGGAASATAQPAVGDIFDISPGSEFRGWQLQSSGIGLLAAPYSVFRLGDVYMIALTEPLVRTAAGGIAVEKIKQILTVRRAAGEEVLDGFDCGFITLSPAIAFYSEATKTARGFFPLPNEIRAARWLVDNPEDCRYGGD